MKIEISSEPCPSKKISITMPESPVLLRLNKQVGCFATGLIEKYSRESIETYGRGTWLECVIVSIDDDLEGIVGLGDSKRWAFVSAIVINAADTRIKKGDLIHFLSYGAERTTLTLIENKTKNNLPRIIRIDFNLSIPTKYGTVIKPPSISTRKHTNYELQYLEITRTLLSRYPDYFPDAAKIYSARYNNQTLKLISGLIHLKSLETLPINTLRSFSKLFWKI